VFRSPKTLFGMAKYNGERCRFDEKLIFFLLDKLFAVQGCTNPRAVSKNTS